MKMPSLLFFLFLTTIFSSITSSKTYLSSFKEQVEKTINMYTMSIDTRDSNTLYKILDQETKLIVVNKVIDKIKVLKRDEFLDKLNKGVVGGWKRNIEIVQIDGNDRIAYAELLLKDKRIKQLEIITLVNNEGNWKIVNSISTIELMNQD